MKREGHQLAVTIEQRRLTTLPLRKCKDLMRVQRIISRRCFSKNLETQRSLKLLQGKFDFAGGHLRGGAGGREKLMRLAIRRLPARRGGWRKGA